MNKAILLGRLGADAEVKELSHGSVTQFNLATTDKHKDKNGEWVEKTDWHKCQVWGKRGEVLAKFLTKGSQVMVEGKVQTRSWDDKDGKRVYVTEINVANIEIMNKPKQNDQQRYFDNGPDALAPQTAF